MRHEGDGTCYFCGDPVRDGGKLCTPCILTSRLDVNEHGCATFTPNARKAPAVRFFVDGSIVCVMRGPNRGKVGTVKRTKMYASLAAGAAGNGVAVLAPFGGGDTFEARADQCTPMNTKDCPNSLAVEDE